MPSAALSSAASGAAAGSAFGPWGTVIGGAIGLVGGLLNKQKAPKAVTVPDYPTVDLGDASREAIDTNLALEGDIQGILSRANRFNQSEALALTEMAMPGWSSLSQKFTKQADDLLTNPYELPKEVESNLARLAAERGISSGARGQFNEFSLLRDFGLNSLQYGQGRINQASNIMSLVGSLAPRVSPLSPLSFYTTPQQAVSNAQANAAGVNSVNLARAGVNQGAANAAAAAQNWNTNNRFQTISDFAMMIPSMIPKGGTGRGATAVEGSYLA